MNNEYIQDKNNKWILKKIVSSPYFCSFITCIIIFAGILVGIETFPEIANKHKKTLNLLNHTVIIIFTIEIILKITAEKKQPLNYFKDGWNIFDFTIVTICFLPLGTNYVSILRLFRLLRVLRLITIVPKLRLLTTALLHSLPSMFYVCILLSLLFYVYGVIGVILFNENDPIHFGNLWVSLLSLFRIVTLEDWTDIMYLQMYGSDIYQGYNISVNYDNISPKATPLIAVLYFVSFVLIGTMVMLNLVIGVIINGMDEAQKELARKCIHTQRKNKKRLNRATKIEKIKIQMKELSKQISEIE